MNHTNAHELRGRHALAASDFARCDPLFHLISIRVYQRDSRATSEVRFIRKSAVE